MKLNLQNVQIVQICKKMYKKRKRTYPSYPHQNRKKRWKKCRFKKFIHIIHTKGIKYGGLFGAKKERAFCGVIIKMSFWRKKPKKTLTFKKSNIEKKLFEDVYTMSKNSYNE